MKILLILASVLLLITTTLHAQKPVENLPELQEWYSWSGALSSHISYLPNFSAQDDAITQYRKGEPTWFNRFPYDTTNQFSWKEGGSKVVTQIDFNNDGIMEYFDTGGRIYTSANKGLIPNPEPVARVSVGNSGASLVEDINGDGFPDLLLLRSPVENSVGLDIVYGGTDLTKLRVAQPISSNPLGKSIAMYFNENKGLRLITYRSSDFSEGFYLYGLTFEGTPNDSVIVSLQLLDKIEEIKQTKSEQIYAGNTSYLYENKKEKEYTLLISYMTSNVRTVPFAIINDKFTASPAMKISTAFKYCLTGSIDGDDEPDWINLDFPVYVYSGNPAKDRTARATIPITKCNLSGSYFYIGDVTGDGIGDIACGKLNCFTIYKGIDWQKLSVTNDLSKVDFTLHQTEPNPIGADGKAVLPATLAHSGNYTLEVYDLTGKRLGELFSGELPSGEIRLPFDVQMLNLPSGMYELRLSDGKHSREHAFVISR